MYRETVGGKRKSQGKLNIRLGGRKLMNGREEYIGKGNLQSRKLKEGKYSRNLENRCEKERKEEEQRGEVSFFLSFFFLLVSLNISTRQVFP